MSNTTTMKTKTANDEMVSAAFRAAFEAHPLRYSDPAAALDSAREDAAAVSATTGQFNDETLTFVSDDGSKADDTEVIIP